MDYMDMDMDWIWIWIWIEYYDGWTRLEEDNMCVGRFDKQEPFFSKVRRARRAAAGKRRPYDLETTTALRGVVHDYTRSRRCDVVALNDGAELRAFVCLQRARSCGIEFGDKCGVCSRLVRPNDRWGSRGRTKTDERRTSNTSRS
jgi:hypothetical protein